MPRRVPKFQVIIDYRDLVKLLDAAEAVEDLDSKLQHLDDKLEALRRIQTETIEKIAQVERDL